MSSIFSFLPRGLSSLADYISPAAFEVVDWKAALRKSATVSKELLFGRKVSDLCDDISLKGLPRGVRFAHDRALGQDPENAWPAPGERVLELYFRQVLGHSRAFLDLRAERFEYDLPSGVLAAPGVLVWKPNGLWVNFNTDFLCGMRSVYFGFYDNDQGRLQLGLRQLGLMVDSLDGENQARLLGLLEEHFGSGRNEPMLFKIAHFMESFDNLFRFLCDRRIRLSEDFLFLGVMLLTLYIHLESLGGACDVRAAFLRAAGLESVAGKDASLDSGAGEWSCPSS